MSGWVFFAILIIADCNAYFGHILLFVRGRNQIKFSKWKLKIIPTGDVIISYLGADLGISYHGWKLLANYHHCPLQRMGFWKTNVCAFSKNFFRRMFAEFRTSTSCKRLEIKTEKGTFEFGQNKSNQAWKSKVIGNPILV